MDELIEMLINKHELSDSEALVVVGIMGMVAYSENLAMPNAFDIVDTKLKPLAQSILAMA